MNTDQVCIYNEQNYFHLVLHKSFFPRTQIANKRDQDKAAATAKRDDAENKDMLLRILENQEELKQIAILHRAGEHIAVELMQKGQEVSSLLLYPT